MVEEVMQTVQSFFPWLLCLLACRVLTRLVIVSLFVSLGGSSVLHAQQTVQRVYRPNIAEEDWAFLADITPSARFHVRRHLLLAVESPSYFRRRVRDGIYGIDLSLLLPGDTNAGKYVGTNPGVVVNRQPAKHITVIGAITRFLSGPFLAATDFENGFGFYSAAFTYRF